MVIPLWWLLILYGFLLLIWLIFSAIALFHVWQFGFKERLIFILSWCYIGLTSLILLVSTWFIFSVDWHQPLWEFSSMKPIFY